MLHAVTETVDSNPSVTPEPGVGSRVRFEVPEDGLIRGLTHNRIHGHTGTVISTSHHDSVDHQDDWVIALDETDMGLGWRGTDYGHPDDICVHFPRENLVIIGHTSTAEDPEPEPPEFNTWRQELYAKAIELGRTRYPSYMRNIERWLREVNVAPKSVTYRISGELKYEASRYPGTTPTISSLSRERLDSLPDVKLEVADATFARRRPGQTIESTTAEIFALVDRVVAGGEVCTDAKVFVRRLGLRPPPRHPHTVKVNLNLNSAELAQLQKANSVDAFLELIRSRARDTRDRLISGIEVVPSETATEPTPAPTRRPRSRSKAATEPAPELVAAT